MIETDICVIGAGPAGLMASIYSAHRGAKVLCADTNSTTALKLLRTGGGRCNLTHDGNIDEFVKVYGSKGRFLKYCLHEFSPKSTVEFFAKNQLKVEPDETGCCFPVTNRASDVKRLLTDLAESFGTKYLFSSRIEHIENQNKLFILQAPREVVVAKAVVIATGGMSWPQTGSSGDGYDFAKAFGHKIVPPNAGLVPLITLDKWAHALTGVTIAKASISAKTSSAKLTTTGAVMFTDNGLGGPAVLDFSRHITEYLSRMRKEYLDIELDIMPDKQLKQVDDYLIWQIGQHPKREIPGILSEFLPRSISLKICEEFEFVRNKLSGQLTKDNRRQLAQLLKAMPFKVKSTRSIREAMVTRGGVLIDEIDPKTMQSKLCPGLFFAGEVIDADGPCGGFNLQICWSTGVLAGTCAYHYANKLSPIK